MSEVNSFEERYNFRIGFKDGKPIKDCNASIRHFISKELERRTEEILKELCPEIISEDYDCITCSEESVCDWGKINGLKAKYLKEKE